MKNQTTPLPQEDRTALQARKAIQQILKSVNDRYPLLNAAAKSKLIVECLIELNEEKKILAALSAHDQEPVAVHTQKAV